LQFTLPGIPVIFAGDEFGLDGSNGENSRTPIPWNNERENDKSMVENYARLIKIRKENPTLVHGSVRFLYVSGEALLFAREDEQATILVLATRFGDPNIKIPMDALPDIERAEVLFGEGQINLIGSSLLLPSKSLSLNIWRLPPPR
jgi:alpha-glucosidase